MPVVGKEQLNQLVYWLLGALLSVALTLGSCTAYAINQRVTELESVKGPGFERLATVETEVKGLREDVRRLEGKVDKLLERR